jgi:hypothetical protein
MKPDREAARFRATMKSRTPLEGRFEVDNSKFAADDRSEIPVAAKICFE